MTRRRPLTVARSVRGVPPGRAFLLALAATLLFATGATQAEGVTAPVPAAVQGADLEEQLGAQLPLDLQFTGSDGHPVLLSQALSGDRPTVMTLVYFNCPMMCGLVLTGLSRSMRFTGLTLGKDFQALTVSFDPSDTSKAAATRQRGFLEAMGHPDALADWPFLTGQLPAIEALTRSVGFHYKYDAETRQFAHPVAVIVLMPGGKVSRYLYGVEYEPRDLRLALVEAAGGKVGTTLDRFMLTCYRYDAAARRYRPYVFGFIRAGGLLVFAALAITLGVLWRRELRGPKPAEGP